MLSAVCQLPATSGLLFHNNRNGYHWVSFKLSGGASNRGGVGAKIRLKATIGGKTFWQMREISGGRASCQDDPRPHFGLGDALGAEVVRIEWPSGILQELTNVLADRFVNVSEPAVLRSVMTTTGGTFALELLGVPNTALEILSSTNLVDWEPYRAINLIDRRIRIEEDCRSPQKFFRVKGPQW